MTVSRNEVVWAFKTFLGREPESEETIADHMREANESALARRLLTSREFLASGRFSDVLRGQPVRGASHLPQAPATARRFVVIGNCQVKAIAKLLEVMVEGATAVPIELTKGNLDRFMAGESEYATLIKDSDVIYMHQSNRVMARLESMAPKCSQKAKLIPPIVFSGFHPDLVYVTTSDGAHVGTPMSDYHSSIAFLGWRCGLSVDETIRLYVPETFKRLGFFAQRVAAQEALNELASAAAISISDLIVKWNTQGCWMHTTNHPKIDVLVDLVERVLQRDGIKPILTDVRGVEDELAKGAIWPVYPLLFEEIKHSGSGYTYQRRSEPLQTYDLREFVSGSFETYAKYQPDELECKVLASERFAAFAQVLLQSKTSGQAGHVVVGKPAKSSNPYQGLPDHQFWRKAIERPSMSAVDPVVRGKFRIGLSDKVATAGSCFAQHISHALRRNGFHYFVTETGRGLDPVIAARKNYGVFSARYGNLYTTRQLLQLFGRAFGHFHADEEIWEQADGRVVDPFRPQIEPEGFLDRKALEMSRTEHLLATRRMFEELDVFVFTLGLTESWRRKSDDAVLPLAPGVAGGKMDESKYEFVNFGVADVTEDLVSFTRLLREVNARARIILTVSPVPLIATYENKHVLVSTTYSKSVLRVAADEAIKSADNCVYFPSYEIVTGLYTRGQYFDTDLRSVRQEGVDHVMRLFFKHYVEQLPNRDPHQALKLEADQMSRIVCDEEAIERR